MRPELERPFIQNYPELYRQYSLSPQETCMCWGFECGDGWYHLIDTLSNLIQNHVDWKKRTDPEFSVEVVQVKEKFASLRYYIHGGDDYIEGLISMAEGMSARICEQCGNPGRIRGTSWYRTLCDDCDREQKSNRKEAPTNDDPIPEGENGSL